MTSPIFKPARSDGVPGMTLAIWIWSPFWSTEAPIPAKVPLRNVWFDLYWSGVRYLEN